MPRQEKDSLRTYAVTGPTGGLVDDSEATRRFRTTVGSVPLGVSFLIPASNEAATIADLIAGIAAKVCKRKLRIYELPVSYYGGIDAEGKKITWRDVFPAARVLARIRFVP